MINYEILEHKADLKLRVFGKSKEKLFENSVFVMQGFMLPETKSPVAKVKRAVKTSSPDEAALLVDFLNEILYLIQANKEIYDKVKFTEFSDTQIKAEVFGKAVERFGEDIKAVTHHGLDIHQKKDKTWQATIIFDV